VVADTACDLPDEIVRAHGIQLVPLSLIFEHQTLRDRFDISADQFAERLRQGAHPSTSQPSPAAFQEGFRRAAEEGEAVVAVLLSSALSGTYGVAQTVARQRPDGEAPVHLVDSRAGTLLQGLMALKAAELGERAWEPERIVAELNRIRAQSGVLVTLDTFERALASGRVKRGQAWLGSLLDIKPVLDVDAQGTLVPISRVRGRKNLVARVMEIVESRVPRSVKKVRFGVVHVACPEMVDEVSRELRARYGDREIIGAPMSPILGTHAGQGAWGVCYLVED